MYMVKYVYMQGAPVENQTPTHCNLIGPSLTDPPPVLSPAFLLRHLRLIAFSFPQGNIRHAFQKCYYFISFFLLF
jgi:hypothetical protein